MYTKPMRENNFETITENIQARAISVNAENYVVMANDMVRGTSGLSLNEAKLLRLIIMQVRKDDKQFFKFKIRTDEFANLLQIDKSNLYREMDKMSTHLLKEVIRIGDGNPRHKWKKFQWISYCEYDEGVLTIRLNDELAPYILGLQEYYTQYRLEEIVGFRSTYSLKIYEMINLGLMGRKPHADKKYCVYVSLAEIRRATNTEDKFERISQFKAKVIDISVKDINKYSPYHVTVEDFKESRSIVGFYFLVESQSGFEYRKSLETKQMELGDYLDENN